MADNKFDEFFRNRISKYSSPVPEDMWQRIEQKKRKTRILFFTLWFLAICLTFFLGDYLIFPSNKHTVGNTSVSGNKLKIKSTNTPDKIIKNSNTKKITPGTVDSLHWNRIDKNVSKQFENKQDENFIYKNKKYRKRHKTNFTGKSFINNQSGDATDLSIRNPDVNIDTPKEQPDTSARQLIKPSLPKDSSLEKKSTPSPNKKQEEKIPIHAVKRNGSLEIYVSPDIPYINRVLNNAGNYNEGKKAPSSYTIGIRVCKYFSKRISVKTGFQYSQISEKFYDSIAIVDRYRSIDILFLIGYDLNNRYFNTTINAGIIYNIYTWYKGQTLIDSLGLIDLNVANIYKHNTGVSLYLGINFSKKINNKIELIAEPYFRYRLSYMTKPSAPFNQKINIAGLNIGLKYNFRKSGKHK